MTRYTNLKNIIQSESIRGNEADSGASLKFIILGATRIANIKSLYKVKVLEVMKRMPE